MLTNNVKVNNFYKLPSGDAVRVVRLDEENDIVIVHNYHSHSNEYFQHAEFCKISEQLYRISEVAKSVGKKSATIRKYENDGLIPKVEKISLNPGGKPATRVYTRKDVEDIIVFFERRKSVGRPARSRESSASINSLHQQILENKRRKNKNG